MGAVRNTRAWSQITKRATRRDLTVLERILHALGRHPRFIVGRRGVKRCIDCGRGF